MRIGVVGGAERIADRLSALAERSGHHLEFHDGHMRGTATDRLRSMIERSDLVVIVTDINSHRAVLDAREIARRAQRPVHFVRRFGTSQLRALAA
jgi:hypothetical protein